MFLSTGLLGYSLINSWNSLCRDASSRAFDPGDNGRPELWNTVSLLWTRDQWFCHYQFPHQHITADPWQWFIFTQWLPQLLPYQPVALGRGKGAVKALTKDLWWCVLLSSSYWSWGEKKENPCVWYSWSMNIFNTFVKQGNGEVSTERQNAAVPTQPSIVRALTCFHTAKSLSGAGCHLSYKFHSTCGTQFSRDWETSLQQHCLLWQIHSSAVNWQEETVTGQRKDAE